MMDRQLKQRVVGAALLVAFGVVFIPIFLDNDALDEAIPPAFELPPPPAADPASPPLPLEQPEIEALERSIDVPPAPPAATATPAPMDDDPAADVAAPLAADAPANPAPEQGSDPAAVPEPAPAPARAPAADGAWAVQLGSFANADNARGLVAKLGTAGHQAYVERREENGAAVFKVRVGPLATRAAAERTRAALEREHATRGMLLPYP